MVTLAGGRAARSPRWRTAWPRPVRCAAEMAAAFAAEANGLRWLAEARAVPVPEVLAVTPAALVISMIPPGQATPEAAFRFGADLARLHAAGADGFGAPWPGFIASLPLDNASTRTHTQWPQWYATPQAAALPPARRGPGRAAARGRAAGGGGDRPHRTRWPDRPSRRAASTATAGPGTCCGPPAGAGSSTRRHTAATARPTWPCWPCSAPRTWTGSWPATRTPCRWRRAGGTAVPLHQLHPLLVHACLFGASYARRGPLRGPRRAVKSRLSRFAVAVSPDG